MTAKLGYLHHFALLTVVSLVVRDIIFSFANCTTTTPSLSQSHHVANSINSKISTRKDETLAKLNNENIKSHTKMSRTAYLITINVSSTRTQRSRAILEEVGFQVQYHVADIMNDRAKSNKLANEAVYRKIVADKEQPWGYIFEDDIMLAGKNNSFDSDPIDFSVERDLVGPGGAEASNPFFLYLGICRGGKDACVERCCGLCTHAYGLSQQGADLFIKFINESMHKNGEGDNVNLYPDHMVYYWCNGLGGFPVLHGDKQSNQDATHFGAFIQDRKSFESIIDIDGKYS